MPGSACGGGLRAHAHARRCRGKGGKRDGLRVQALSAPERPGASRSHRERGPGRAGPRAALGGFALRGKDVEAEGPKPPPCSNA